MHAEGAAVVFSGRIAPAAVRALLEKSCIAVLPNRADADSAFTSPIKLFEYMAAGCAVVAADLPAAEDPFEGLCRCDPAHGPAVTEAPMRPDGLVRPSCRSCREKADEGSPQMRRMVPGPAGPIPFDS